MLDATGMSERELDDALRNDLYEAVYEDFIGPINEDQEEVLEIAPDFKYSAGILNPIGAGVWENRVQDEGRAAGTEGLVPAEVEQMPEVPAISSSINDEEYPEEEPISLSNAHMQSAISMTIAVPCGSRLDLRAMAARYADEYVDTKRVYKRKPIAMDLKNIEAPESEGEVNRYSFPAPDDPLQIWIVHRRTMDGANVITVALCNTKAYSSKTKTEDSYYQVKMQVTCKDGFMPPVWQDDNQGFFSDEEASNELLYRNIRNYAVGHGCATKWNHGDAVTSIETQTMPVAETYEMDPVNEVMKEVNLSLLSFSDATQWGQTRASMSRMCELYESWIGSIKIKANSLEERYVGAAKKNIAQCEICLKRMRAGIAYLDENLLARKAFTLMNEAMYDQFLHYSVVSGVRAKVDEPLSYVRMWRAFQLGFILMNLQSVTDPHCEERAIVDLIWFPTGGGKTEAYLGLSAFALIYERLAGDCSDGVTVIMRYTLRLLTSQQFDRASSLICALELMRRRMSELGSREFRIGLWVGGLSPNRRYRGEKSATNMLMKFRREGGKNPFPIRCCPWCGAKMDEHLNESYVYKGPHSRVSFVCPNEACEFTRDDGLPVDVVDDELYERPPSILVGTVDKFANLPYLSEALSLFGYKDGKPGIAPKLIIQDELHLISGPLGSMVGHYETLVQELCTREINNQLVGPKIVASTATVSRAKEQCNQLYACGEENVFQFPPAGIDYDDSFFSFENRKKGGRRYVGVFAPDSSSNASASILLFADLLRAPALWEEVPDEWRDYFWTIMGYFGTTRELGIAMTWVEGDIPERMREMRNRFKKQGLKLKRYVNVAKELTSRKDADEISQAMEQLKIAYPNKGVIDLCFATNMISVGLDVSRLGLMVVTGQPKSTAEYIQATSRVGRGKSHGIVFVFYNKTKPRDRSHYENFAVYHESFYKNVEPSSVTPFCKQVRDRALFGTLAGMYRSYPDGMEPDAYAYPSEDAFDCAASVIAERVSKIDPGELPGLEEEIEEIYAQWSENNYARWSESSSQLKQMQATTPLMHPWGGLTPQSWGAHSFGVPQSMRSVDKECRIAITPSLGSKSRRDKRNG